MRQAKGYYVVFVAKIIVAVQECAGEPCWPGCYEAMHLNRAWQQCLILFKSRVHKYILQLFAFFIAITG